MLRGGCRALMCSLRGTQRGLRWVLRWPKAWGWEMVQGKLPLSLPGMETSISSLL